ncbi:hypothetical protein Nmel_017363 [Mimus melanotis]
MQFFVNRFVLEKLGAAVPSSCLVQLFWLCSLFPSVSGAPQLLLGALGTAPVDLGNFFSTHCTESLAQINDRKETADNQGLFRQAKFYLAPLSTDSSCLAAGSSSQSSSSGPLADFRGPNSALSKQSNWCGWNTLLGEMQWKGGCPCQAGQGAQHQGPTLISSGQGGETVNDLTFGAGVSCIGLRHTPDSAAGKSSLGFLPEGRGREIKPNPK